MVASTPCIIPLSAPSSPLPPRPFPWNFQTTNMSYSPLIKNQLSTSGEDSRTLGLSSSSMAILLIKCFGQQNPEQENHSWICVPMWKRFSEDCRQFIRHDEFYFRACLYIQVEIVFLDLEKEIQELSAYDRMPLAADEEIGVCYDQLVPSPL